MNFQMLNNLNANLWKYQDLDEVVDGVHDAKQVVHPEDGRNVVAEQEPDVGVRADHEQRGHGRGNKLDGSVHGLVWAYAHCVKIQHIR